MNDEEEKIKRIPAVVLGMSANGLSVARSLGRKGIPVFGMNSTKYQAGMFSRYCKPVICPDPLRDESGFLEFLVKFAKRHPQKPVLMLTADKYIQLVSRNREELLLYYRFLLPDAPLVEAFLDKRKSYQLAEQYGLAHPKSYSVKNEEDLKNIIPELKFPCALKPALSHIWKLKFGAKKLIVAQTPEDLLESFSELREEGQKVMVQEIIPGRDEDIYALVTYFNQQHEPLAVFTKRKLRQFPIYFGVSTLGISERNETVLTTGIEFLKKVNYSGLAGIEFKYDVRDNKFKFTEVNIRTLLSGEMAVASGVDLPYIYYRDLTGEKVEKVETFKEGVKLVNLELDIASFWYYWKKKELTLPEWIRSLKGNLKHTYFALDDLNPFLFECIIFLTKIWRRREDIF
ncbi:MAG: hypothetical protein AB1481_07180 [Candidatus Omnitrophota bacterium]